MNGAPAEGDILIESEQVRRVVATLDRREPILGRARICRTDALVALGAAIYVCLRTCEGVQKEHRTRRASLRVRCTQDVFMRLGEC